MLEALLSLIFAFFVLVGIYATFFRTPAIKGAEGEFVVRVGLNLRLDKNEYHQLHDLTVPSGNGTTQIDHLVVSRFGLFVIETKNMGGWIFGGARQRQWTQTFPKKKRRFQNPLNQNYKHVKALQELLGIAESKLHNLVVFIGDAEPKTDLPKTVMWSNSELAAYIKAHREPVFADREVGRMLKVLLGDSLEPTKETRKAHIAHVKANVARRNDPANCPRCGAEMVERFNRKSGERFLGCSRFPKCRGTRRGAP